ncbi:MAG: hypothetical protein ACE5GU_12675 [Candidatus Scalinduaceae bacterium]
MKMFLLRYLLNWFKNKILSEEFADDKSSVVDCVDYLLEKIKWIKVKY